MLDTLLCPPGTHAPHIHVLVVDVETATLETPKAFIYGPFLYEDAARVANALRTAWAMTSSTSMTQAEIDRETQNLVDCGYEVRFGDELDAIREAFE